jgi:hypothetical protein
MTLFSKRTTTRFCANGGIFCIFTTPIVHDEFKGLRITPNVYTTIDELNRFCAVMESVAKKGLPKD